MKLVSDIKNGDISGKTAILRIDLNISPKDAESSWRLNAVIPTIKLLLDKGARVVILSHTGRPESIFNFQGGQAEIKTGKKIDNIFSLAFARPILEKNIGRTVQFLPDFDFREIKEAIKNSGPGSVFLLENLRFFEEEEGDDRTFAQTLASLGDVYVNDAFSVSHRAHASVHAITSFLPSYAGLCLASEVKNLSDFLDPPRPLVVIMGGAKIAGKIDSIKSLLARADYLLTGGGLANNLLKAKGVDIGESLYDKDRMADAAELIKSEKVVVPVDWASEGNRISDIGAKTQELYGRIIASAKSVIWNGPVGYFEKPEFSAGSESVAMSIIKSGAKSVAGGGETAAFLMKKGLASQFGFVSTGGGAMLQFLAGEKLPGLEALK